MAELLYSTGSGQAWLGDAAATLREVCDPESADLVLTSPPSEVVRHVDDNYLRTQSLFDAAG
jgi:hypothetical protein